MNESTYYYGWYSPSMESVGGSTVWRHEDGSEVVITEVTRTPEQRINRDDVVSLGKVTKYLRKGVVVRSNARSERLDS